jgi:hypothetical protein
MATHKPLQEHAFWLYGVLVGLAIKAGLEGTLPHIIQYSQLAELLTPEQLARPQATYGFYPDLIRLVLLLILIVRFYLGAAYFFGDVYPKEAASAPLESEDKNAEIAQVEKTNYALDFISGFAHFLAFVILGLTIDVHTKPIPWFPIVVVFILLYDALWWAFSIPYKKTRKIIKWWALVNSVNVVASLVVFLALLLFKFDTVLAELWSYVLVFAVSAYDIGAMMKGHPYFQGLRDQLSE